MKQGYLSQYFSGVAFKRLSAVEADPESSHQHELNGVAPLKAILGPERREFPTQFFRLDGDNAEPLSADGKLTWYDAREHHPTRSEWRLYYSSNPVAEAFQAGDLVLVARENDDQLLLLAAAPESTSENQLRWLFGLEDPTGMFKIKREELDQRRLEFTARQILELIGVQIVETDAGRLERLQARFGLTFPPTKFFSKFAREETPDVDAVADPDGTLMAWMDKEELLFRTFERFILTERLQTGFKDVDDFIAFSLSVQNRRKSRVGFALENHLAALFDENGIQYSHGVATELNSKPDFIFPGISEYRAKEFPTSRLTVLGAKTTCKDRWRQVLSEAAKISEKHLITLEAGISENQTTEMAANMLRLVVPQAIHATFNPIQQQWLLDVQEFVELVRGRQL